MPASHPTTPLANVTENSISTPSRLFSHTKLDPKNSSETDLTNEPGMNNVHALVQLDRLEQNVNKEHKVFVAVAWVVKQELRWFKMFPEVVHVDATSHSTEKKFHLLTFSVKTAFGKQVVFLRMWIPNQKRSTFRWFFRHCLARLFPKHILGTTK